MKKGTPGNKGGPSFKDGDLVFAKVKGYPAWPARVSAPADERASNIMYFSTEHMKQLSSHEIQYGSTIKQLKKNMENRKERVLRKRL